MARWTNRSTLKLVRIWIAYIIKNFNQFLIIQMFRVFRNFSLHLVSMKKKNNFDLQKLVDRLIKMKDNLKKHRFEDYKPDFNNEKHKKISLFILTYLGLSYFYYELKQQRSEQIQLQNFRQIIQNSMADAVYINKLSWNRNYYILKMSVNGKQYHYISPNLSQIQAQIQRLQINKTLKIKLIIQDDQPLDATFKRLSRTFVKVMIPLLFPFLLFNSKLGNIFKSNFLGKQQIMMRPNVLFKDIAGLGNAKIQVSQLVDFLKNPDKYKKIGARVPKGALLAGPPGTGKTMLAKACAGQANVPFFSVSGSQFVQLFVGMGAKRVRELFQNAKKQTPSIIFIDEIDAIGKKRQDKSGAANDERANTLNQILVEMDGFGTSDDIIVLAATNRKQMLDNALIRPGRFDRIVQIELPDLQGRKQILLIYLSKIKISPNQALEDYAKRIATLTFGFSGADLANLCNEAAIIAVRKQRQFVQSSDFEEASDRVLAGIQQSTALSNIEKRKVAFHESGHAVTAWFLQGASPLLKITIIPRSKGALGFAQYLPNQSTLATKQDLIDQMCVILGGRIAEQIFFGQVTNGASDDLQKVRKLAYMMIVSYGMSEKNKNYAPVETDGHNIYSQQAAQQIDKQIIDLIRSCTEKTREILNKHKEKVKGLAEGVLEKEVLNHQQIRQILGERPFPSKQTYRQFIEELGKIKKAQQLA